MEAVEPDRANVSRASGGNRFGGHFQTPRAHGQAVAREIAIHFAINGEESIAQRGIGKMSCEARTIASGGGELGDSVRQRSAESWHVNHAREFRTVEAARGRF